MFATNFFSFSPKFAAEAPERVEKKKEEKSWWDRWLYGDDEEEIIVPRPEHQTSILGQLSEEEKERLYRAIRYDVNENLDKSQGVSVMLFWSFRC